MNGCNEQEAVSRGNKTNLHVLYKPSSKEVLQKVQLFKNWKSINDLKLPSKQKFGENRTDVKMLDVKEKTCMSCDHVDVCSESPPIFIEISGE